MFFLNTNKPQPLVQNTALAVRPLCHFFFFIHRIPAFHSLNQVRAALQPAIGAACLIISGATLEGATLFMPIIPSGVVGVISLMSKTPVS